MWKSVIISFGLALAVTKIGFCEPEDGRSEPPGVVKLGSPGDVDSRTKHMTAALKHLEAAGLDDLAGRCPPQKAQPR